MKKFLVIIIILVIIALWWRWYLGWFTTLQVEEREMWPYTMVYVEHVGDYKKVGPIMDQIYQTLTKADINQQAGIGVYYDNPATTPVDQLKSEVGSIINPEDMGKIADLWVEYKTKTIEKANKVVVSFPYKNKLSYMIGPMKVYPVLEKYIAEKGYVTWNAAIELYDVANKMIYFMLGK